MKSIKKIFGRSDGKRGGTDPAAGTGEGTSKDSPPTDEEKRLLRHMRMMRGGFYDSDDDLDDIDEEEERMLRKMAQRGMMGPDLFMFGGRSRNRNNQPTGPSRFETQNDKDKQQREWNLPALVEPDPGEDDRVMPDQEIMRENHGVIQTGALLYHLTVTEEGQEEHHSILKMPEDMPDVLAARASGQGQGQESRTFNMLMVDTSGSMSSYWSPLVEGWNTHVAPVLKGRTVLYRFSSDIHLIREGTELQSRDIDHGSTDLTGALQKIADEVYTCREKYIKVFLVTDGDHNCTRVTPAEVLEKILAPACKVVDVYVLGAGNSFPVQYSITLRSLLHNGSSNLPSLFWSKDSSGMNEQMQSIGACISSGSSHSIQISQEGRSLPGTEPKQEFHLNEWVYFPSGPEAVQNLTMTNGSHSCQVVLQAFQATPDMLNTVFRQWNSILIQLHNKKEPLPPDSIPFMQKLFKASMGQRGAANSIQERLDKKSMATQETDFQTLMNKLRDLLTKNSFSNQLELADNILSTTVGGGKFESKVLKLKGHTDDDYKKDCEEFLRVLAHQKSALAPLDVTPEDCCHVMMTSTLGDLKDPEFPRMMTELNKFEFLREFTISGIGVHAPMRDSITINPWSFGVKSILGQPYSVVSQKAMEHHVNIKPIAGQDQKSQMAMEGSVNVNPNTRRPDKEIQLDQTNMSTQFNAVVPVFPPEAASVMEPLVRTRLYAMCTTFAILKNPHMVDLNVHFAALGVTWVRLLHEYPNLPRPEHVSRRIKSIEATAKLYVNRPGYAKYWEVLKKNTAQGLMTESIIEEDGRTIKCESLIKPMFILHLMQQQEAIDTATLTRIIEMLLLEYVGRCIRHHTKDGQQLPTPFTDFFAEELSGEEKRREWSERHLTDMMSDSKSQSYKLKDFYTKERVEKEARVEGMQKLKDVQERFTDNIPIAINTGKVEQLRNVTAAGDVSWPTLRTFVSELGLPENLVEELFSKKNLVVYTVHALLYNNSRERLTKQILGYEEAMEKATHNVKDENKSLAGGDILPMVVKGLINGWMQEYATAHRDVVKPMTPAQIVAEARERGVDVTEATFTDVYRRYRADTGLLGNACQSRACPYFLMPDRSYNQHASVERLNKDLFPHAFHKAAYVHRQDPHNTALTNLEAGIHRPPRGPKTPISQQCVRPLSDKLANLQILYRNGIQSH